MNQRRDSITEAQGPVRPTPGAARFLPWLIRAGVLYPWAWLGSVYAVWAVAWVTLGRRPRPLLDDPKTLGNWVDLPHTVSVLMLALAMPVLGTSIAAALTLAFTGRMRWRSAFGWLGALLLSWSLAVVLARLNPGHVVAWYAD